MTHWRMLVGLLLATATVPGWQLLLLLLPTATSGLVGVAAFSTTTTVIRTPTRLPPPTGIYGGPWSGSSTRTTIASAVTTRRYSSSSNRRRTRTMLRLVPGASSRQQHHHQYYPHSISSKKKKTVILFGTGSKSSGSSKNSNSSSSSSSSSSRSKSSGGSKTMTPPQQQLLRFLTTWLATLQRKQHAVQQHVNVVSTAIRARITATTRTVVPTQLRTVIRPVGALLLQLGMIVQLTGKKFVTGYGLGYTMSFVWKIISCGRGGTQPWLWALDCGSISAIFTASAAATQLLVRTPPKNVSYNTEKRFLVVSLWSIVIRNGLLAAYFEHANGFRSVKLLRSVLIYTGLTYIFVSRKFQRTGMSMNTPMRNRGSRSSVNSRTDMLNMVNQILQQQQQAAAAAGAAGGSGGRSGQTTNQPKQQQQRTNNNNAGRQSSTGFSSSSSSSKSGSAAAAASPPPPSDFLDVEWTANDDDINNDSDDTNKNE